MRLGGNQRKVYANGGVDIAGSDFARAIIEKRMLAHFGLGRVNGQVEKVLLETLSDAGLEGANRCGRQNRRLIEYPAVYRPAGAHVRRGKGPRYECLFLCGGQAGD